MGMISIDLKGSFRINRIKGNRTFFANRRGHASAVAEAIRYLSGVILPSAIKQDHELHEEGQKPDIEFGGEDAI